MIHLLRLVLSHGPGTFAGAPKVSTGLGFDYLSNPEGTTYLSNPEGTTALTA